MITPDFYGYCITVSNGMEKQYVSGIFRAPGDGRFILTKNKNLAYLYDKMETAQLIAREFPGSSVEKVRR